MIETAKTEFHAKVRSATERTGAQPAHVSVSCSHNRVTGYAFCTIAGEVVLQEFELPGVWSKELRQSLEAEFSGNAD